MKDYDKNKELSYLHYWDVNIKFTNKNFLQMDNVTKVACKEL